MSEQMPIQRKRNAPASPASWMGKCWAVQFLIGFLCYLLLFGNQLTNHYDGLWSYSQFRTSAWEISLGRWLFPALTTLFSGYAGDPFHSLVSIAVIAFANTLLLCIFRAEGRAREQIYAALFMVSSTVCVYLSYRFQAPAFALSYLASVACVWFLHSYAHPVWGFVWAVCCLVCSLALYQSHIGCTCLLIVAGGMIRCLRKSKKKHLLFRHMLRSALAVVAGIIIYTVIWKLIMLLQGIGGVAYKGAGSLSVMQILISLPASVLRAYSEFFRFYFSGELLHSLFQANGLFTILMILFALALAASVVLLALRSIRRAACLLVLLLLLPPAVNFSLLLAPGNALEMQMTGPLALTIPVLLFFLDAAFAYLLPRFSRVRETALATAASVLVFGCAYQTACDLNVMFEGTNATRSLMQSIVTSAVSQDVYQEDGPCAFIGIPSENPMVQKSALWSKANQYARFGQWPEGENSLKSYRGMLYSMGVNWPTLSNEAYNDLLLHHEELLRAMPLYPHEGSMQVVDGITVVKVSNSPYQYGLDKPAALEQPSVSVVWYEPALAGQNSRIHITTRSDIAALALHANQTTLGTWSEADVEMIPYPMQNSKEWIIEYPFAAAGSYVMDVSASLDGMHFYKCRIDSDNVLVIKDQPVKRVDYDVEHEGLVTRILVTTDASVTRLTMNLGENELGSWTAADKLAVLVDQNTRVWTIEHRFDYAGAYSLWFKTSSDGENELPWSPESDLFIPRAPLLDLWYQPAVEDVPAFIHVSTNETTQYLKLFVGDREQKIWHSSEVEVIPYAEQMYREWILPCPFDVQPEEAVWFSASEDGEHYNDNRDLHLTPDAFAAAP